MRIIARAYVILFVSLAAIACALSPAFAESAFSSWAAVVIAGDWHRNRTENTWAFDNARRDVAKALVAVGFDRANVREFSAQPKWFPDDPPAKADIADVGDALERMTSEGRTGCLLYLTTHGRKDGDVWFGEDSVSPARIREALDRACGDRPTVVIVSACYSGGLVPALQTPARLILTSASAGRQSFVCGVGYYPEFDNCVLQALPKVRDFIALGRSVQACVAAREAELRLPSPSEPRLAIGDAAKPILQAAEFPPRL